VQAATPQPVPNRFLSHTQLDQLRSRHDAVLLPDQLPDVPGPNSIAFCGHSPSK
jgi:hypothetical protein